MPRTKSSKKSTPKRGRRASSALSERTRKQIDTLPKHAQRIYQKAHSSALEEYKTPSKRRGGTKTSVEQVAHKVAWAAVKKKYKKSGKDWVKKGRNGGVSAGTGSKTRTKVRVRKTASRNKAQLEQH